jgi:predicted TIM-barrel fold metal-dependent hydrolase
MNGAERIADAWDCHVHVFDANAPVKAGHYTPAHRSLMDIEQLAAQHGVGHLVLVQPSIYGFDNAVMLRALKAGQGRHRGVVVLNPSLNGAALEAELDLLHAAGVRGVRFNLVSPLGLSGRSDSDADVAADLHRWAPALRERGWHVQWYVHADALPRLVKWQADTGLPFVLDHMAGLHASLNADDPAWAAAQALANGGAWIKLSGWYRLVGTQNHMAPLEAEYTALHHNIQRVAAMFGRNMVWGSDWPHTSFAADNLPSYDSNLQPVRTALGNAALQAALHDNARTLYFN